MAGATSAASSKQIRRIAETYYANNGFVSEHALVFWSILLAETHENLTGILKSISVVLQRVRSNENKKMR